MYFTFLTQCPTNAKKSGNYLATRIYPKVTAPKTQLTEFVCKRSENFPVGQFLRKANKCFGVCKVK
jgi:hypothetical protein